LSFPPRGEEGEESSTIAKRLSRSRDERRPPLPPLVRPADVCARRTSGEGGVMWCRALLLLLFLASWVDDTGLVVGVRPCAVRCCGGDSPLPRPGVLLEETGTVFRLESKRTNNTKRGFAIK
jgi:hypothetical protein